ncbi:MAG TPA: hypothetical protein VFI15_11010 [Candidatus Limnocylindrales bacterium]|nr:hypothetical protein [Candidatus Limnocylindrales bacterium]
MDVELRAGLVEVAGTLPTFASAGVEERAVSIGRIAADSYDYLASLLGFRPAIQVLVVTEADWSRVTETPIYGLPNAGNGTLVVAGDEPPLWSAFADMVQPADRPEFDRVYGLPDGSFRLGPFMDLIAVHEVAHVFHQGTQHFPRLWLQELFANLCTHAWVADRSPADLEVLTTLPRLGAAAPASAWEHSTREDFETQYTGMGGPNYVWYQFRLQVEAAAMYERSGTAVVRRLFDAFNLPDDALARRLAADVDPGLGEFSLAF